MITVLTGGTGGAKFVWGLAQVVPKGELTVIVNTGDDLLWWGLHVSPDIDSVTYALAGSLSKDRGWGYEGDSFRCLERMTKLGAEAWFQLGDLDLATHLRRTQLLSEGKTLSDATAVLCSQMGLQTRVLPMSNQKVQTQVMTSTGNLAFQEYFVREHCKPAVLGVEFHGVEKASAAPEVLEAIKRADAIFLAPSNPVTSIGPILSVPGIRNALRSTSATVAAVSPIVGGAAVSGPAGAMMRMRGWPVSAAGVTKAYCDFVRVLVADIQDESELSMIESAGVRAVFAQTIMRTEEDKIALAKIALASLTKQAEV
jgi:LPPG:FO 2-phospho-L-lactate transferase